MTLAELSPFWSELFQQNLLKVSALVVTSAASFVLGRWWGKRQAGQEWKRKEFLNRLQVTLNGFHEGRLEIRTLIERPLEDVFFNAVAMSKVLAASKRATEGNPLLPMKKDDCWFLLNFVLNSISEHFSAGVVRKDAGQPVAAVRYAIFLTCEPVAHGRVRKVRAMMIRPELLRNFPYPDSLPELEQPWHDIRVRTLRRAAELYHSHPENFIEIEICA